MDYGYVSPDVDSKKPDEQDVFLRTLFQTRANTHLVGESQQDLNAFITYLASGPSEVTLPVGNILLGSHANSEGWIKMPLYELLPFDDKGLLPYEQLQRSLDAPLTEGKSLKIPDSVLGAGGNPHYVHFKGCNVGKAAPFVAKLKEALGSRVLVTAPKHFHGINPQLPVGVFEYMGYEFMAQTKARLRTRAAVLQLFKDTLARPDTRLRWADGTKLEERDLERFLPAKVQAKQLPQRSVPLAEPIGRTRTLQVRVGFRIDIDPPFQWPLRYGELALIPKDESELLTDLTRSLSEHELFIKSDDPSVGTPFPVYERKEFANVAEFVDGHTWSFAPPDPKRPDAVPRVVCSGRRVQYVLVQPIRQANNSTSHVLYNFHPATGTPVIGLPETDPKYYLTV